MKPQIFLMTGLLPVSGCADDRLMITSPDKSLSVQIHLNPENSRNLTYSIQSQSRPVISDSPISLEFKAMAPLGANLVLKRKRIRSVNEPWERVWKRRKKVVNRFREMTLFLEEGSEPFRRFNLTFRAYDDGIAFRYEIPEQKGFELFRITSESRCFRFVEKPAVWAAEYGYASHQEAAFQEMTMVQIGDRIMGLPVLINIEETLWAAISEADLTDWAGMYLSSGSEGSLVRKLSPLPDGPGISGTWAA